MFDAVAAGIPLIGEKNTTAGDYIEKYNLGIVAEDISKLPKLNWQVYKECQDNVLKIRNNICLDQDIGKLEELYKNI